MQCAYSVLSYLPAPLYAIFPHYLINGTIFEKQLLNTKFVVRFFSTNLTEKFFILRRIERDMIKNVYTSLCKVSFILYFRTVHVVIFILFKPTHALFLKHIHIHI